MAKNEKWSYFSNLPTDGYRVIKKKMYWIQDWKFYLFLKVSSSRTEFCLYDGSIIYYT